MNRIPCCMCKVRKQTEEFPTEEFPSSTIYETELRAKLNITNTTHAGEKSMREKRAKVLA